VSERLSQRVRERAIGRLKRGYAFGALGTQTFERRLETALSCDSSQELRQVTSDLAPPSLADGLRQRLAGARSEPASSGLLRGLALCSPTVIGRMPACDLVVVDDSVSRRHAMLSREHGRVVVTDLGSTNGTYLNGRWVTRAEVRPGDRLQLGLLEFLL
jgi:hypothetical protein